MADFNKNPELEEELEENIITLTDEEDIPEVLTKLRVIYKNIMKLDYDNKRSSCSNRSI